MCVCCLVLLCAHTLPAVCSMCNSACCLVQYVCLVQVHPVHSLVHAWCLVRPSVCLVSGALLSVPGVWCTPHCTWCLVRPSVCLVFGAENQSAISLRLCPVIPACCCSAWWWWWWLFERENFHKEETRKLFCPTGLKEKSWLALSSMLFRGLK